MVFEEKLLLTFTVRSLTIEIAVKENSKPIIIPTDDKDLHFLNQFIYKEKRRLNLGTFVKGNSKKDKKIAKYLSGYII